MARSRYDDDDEDRPRRRRREEDDYEDRPRGRSRADDEDDRPRRRRDRDDEDDYEEDDAVATIIPYKNGRALAAYYCGVFGLIPGFGLILGPLALTFGLLGLSYAKHNRKAKGGGHAIAGIILGSLETIAHLGLIVVVAILYAKSK